MKSKNYIKIPKHIIQLMTDKEVMDRLFTQYTDHGLSRADAYDSIVEKVQKYAASWKPYKDVEAYMTARGNRQLVEIPIEIVEAVCNKDKFDDLVYSYTGHKTLAESYYLALAHCKISFPEFNPYSNFRSYEETRNRRHRSKTQQKS